MALPVPGAGRKGLVDFTLFGFPVSIHPSFLVVVFFLGFTGPGATWQTAVIWLVVVTVSVIVHELGHAVVAAPAGGEPRIDLYGMAGLTRWNPARAGRGRRVAVSLAGPGFGLLLGVVVYAVSLAVDPAKNSLIEEAFAGAVWANVAWGVLNLLPMLPLDGGQIVFALMPGRDEETRLKRAAYGSIAVAVVVVLLAITNGQTFAALLVMFFAAGNIQTVVALGRAGREDPATARLRDAEVALAENRPDDVLRLLPDPSSMLGSAQMFGAWLRAAALLRTGREREAQRVLLDLPEGARVDPVFEAAVLLANGQERLARERLAVAVANRPSPWAVRELATLLVRRGDDVDALLDGVTGDAAGAVMTALYHGGRYAEAARWGDTALATGSASGLVAYDTACAWARTGDADRALRALDDAVQLGWRDVRAAEADADLEQVRALPAYAAVRDRMASVAGLGEQHARG
jgi:Zn-dependent protease